MRVASRTIYEVIKYNLSNINEDLNHANEIVSTGKLINDPSDDPVGLTQALNIKSALSNFEQLGRNISMGTSWLTSSESAMTNVQDLISDAKALCVQMASSTTGTAQRVSASKEVENMLEDVISLANTELNGRYIFSGCKTDTTPFSQDGTYNGDSSPFEISTGKDSSVQVGFDGEAVFGTIISTLSGLKEALATDDVDLIQASMDNLDSDFDNLSNSISDVGSKMLRMEMKGNILQDLEINNSERLSKIEDADLAEAIIDLEGKKIAYQAALSSSADVIKLSLMDYL